MSHTPPVDIPITLARDFTMDFTISVYHWYLNETIQDGSRMWTKEFIQQYLDAFTNINILTEHPSIKDILPYQEADKHILRCLSNISILNKSIAVIGSITPWIEAILLNNGATNITTVEYNVPIIENHPYLKAIHYDEFVNSNTKYDYIFSYSSIEHCGLGRYGDPLNPNGDIEAMNVMYEKLERVLYLAIPVGQDSLVWNAHRIYGSKRLEKLFEKFEEIRWIGHSKEDVLDKISGNKLLALQPTIALRKKP